MCKITFMRTGLTMTTKVIYHLNVELWFDEQEVYNDDNLVLVEWNVVSGCSPQLAQHLFVHYKRRRLNVKQPR